MKGDFFKCGAIGWCMEVFWTGMHAIGKKDWKMTGKSSLWMFPIYGMAACIGPVSRYSSGMLLKKYHLCPWDYSQVPYNYKGVIRLDYAPVWFFTGLLYEKILSKKR